MLKHDWREVAKKYDDTFTEVQQHELRKEWEKCGKAPYVQICITHAMRLNPVLNQSRLIR